MDDAVSKQRNIGPWGATSVGLGAIVGGGILVLGGVAFEHAGPGALLAFALNGIIALLTALSFAEMSTAFPENGGPYMFAKRVLSVRAAFAVGWVVWLAYVLGGVLYAVGFAAYGLLLVKSSIALFGAEVPLWLDGRSAALTMALVPIGLYLWSLIRKSGGGGHVEVVGKLAVFGFLIIAGLFVLATGDTAVATAHLSPFLPQGVSGVLTAMGFTFIALQGVDLIAAIGGEVRDPQRTIPRGMLGALAIALIVYLPLLFIVATVGVSPNTTVAELSRANPETFMAVAAENFLGRGGFWLVIVAAVLSTLSALRACLFAASRVALAMAQDRTLPTALAELHPESGTPMAALAASGLTMGVIAMMVPNVAAAGAAASLIFLIAFALTHGMAYLARVRHKAASDARFEAPFFPFVPIAGGAACAALAVFQALAVPAAGYITLLWLGFGLVLYRALFASRAERLDAFEEGADPEVLSMRGASPLVLVPVANPTNAASLVSLASMLAPPEVGSVVLLSVMPPPSADRNDQEIAAMIDRTQAVIHRALIESFRDGHAPEALLTVGDAPWAEIERVARSRRCQSLVLGLSGDPEGHAKKQLEMVINRIDCNVAVLTAPEGFRFADAKRVLIPVGGRGRHHALRARFFGRLHHMGARTFEFLRVLPAGATDAEVANAERELRVYAADEVGSDVETKVVVAADVTKAVADASHAHDLVVLGLSSHRGRRSLGAVAVRIAGEASCATVLLGTTPDAVWRSQQMIGGIRWSPGAN